MKDVIIGIDFGTTNSLCAAMDGDRPVVIPNSRGARTTPSVVAVSARGEILVGESARNQGLIWPENTVAGVKRHLAAGGLLSMGSKGFRPEEIAALVLGSLRQDAERHLQREVRHAVITAPAHFSEKERRSLVEAGRLAGLDVLKIINEPTAAALARAYGEILPLAGKDRGGPPPSAPGGPSTKERPAKGAKAKTKVQVLRPEARAPAEASSSIILVYDFGGGTFDVTVLSQGGSECKVLSSRGDGRLGGGDIDRELYRRAARAFLESDGLDVESDRILVQALMDQAERAKIELSERSESSLSIPFAVAGTGEGAKVVHPVHTVTLGEFETLAMPFVERSIELTKRALADARLAPADIDTLVLSGGTSRMPLVRRRLLEELGLTPAGGVNPEEIVAMGAAVAAALEGDSPRLRFHDVVSRTYGVEIDGGFFVPLIRKNSPVPAQRSRTFTTVENDQDSVEIHVLQGESRRADENLSLGRFLLAGLKVAKAGEPQIKVDFSIDESDILHVAAVDLETGQAQAISIADLGRGAADETPAVLVERALLLAARLGELKKGLELEAGLEAELDEIMARAGKAGESMGEGELRLLKAELEGLVGELLARRAEKGNA